MGYENGLVRSDIIPLVAKGWAKSFADVDQNKKAIADCGWGLCTYNCLDHPDVSKLIAEAKKDFPTYDNTPNIDINELNTDGNFAGDCILKLVERHAVELNRKGNEEVYIKRALIGAIGKYFI